MLVAERGEAFGGTTALSGGRVWLPGNGHATDAGIDDSPEAAAAYLRAACPTAPDGHVEAFVAGAPDVAAWIERATPHRFVLCPRYPEYHPSLPGATLGGRTLDSAPFAAGDLDQEVLRGPASAPVTHAEWERWRFVHRYDADLLAERDAARVVTGGRALVAALLQACRAAGVALVTGARVTALRTGSDGVTGAEVTGDGGGTRTRSPAAPSCSRPAASTGATTCAPSTSACRSGRTGRRRRTRATPSRSPAAPAPRSRRWSTAG